MESMSSAELVELSLLILDITDAQFQYWLAATFAVVVAAYTARDTISNRMGAVISVMYILVTFLFVLRYIQVSGNEAIYSMELIGRGVPPIESPIGLAGLASLRLLVILVGSGIALWFLNMKLIEKSDDET